ncbi:uncharacterized protein LOC143216147 [Lasioglossum baleicum]|uniref:uncharacterized protein LOC143216147 n=1 Tax=Lasioglossum baleicum TaxID=434251 RepID=UPI003FCED340
MAHPSNPRLMNRVVDAVVHLGEGKGSTARDVLDFLRYSSKSAQRNLTMQVHRALKHAVNAGLLRHRSGRYKALFTLNPAPVKQPVNETNDEKSVGGSTTLDVEHQPSRKVSPDRKENTRGKRKKPRHGRKHKRSRSRSRIRRRRHRSESSNSPMEDTGPVRKYKHKDNGQRDQSPRRRISDGNTKADIGSSSSNRRRGKTQAKDEDYSSDLSDSDYEDRKSKAKKNTALRQECKSSESGKVTRRSCSRNRSPQRQKSQQLQPKRSHEDVKRNKTDAEGHRTDDQNDLPQQDMENEHAPDNSASGSTL